MNSDEGEDSSGNGGGSKRNSSSEGVEANIFHALFSVSVIIPNEASVSRDYKGANFIERSKSRDGVVRLFFRLIPADSNRVTHLESICTRLSCFIFSPALCLTTDVATGAFFGQ
jgi:hypothetical protein